jgi:hypothetical protein
MGKAEFLIALIAISFFLFASLHHFKSINVLGIQDNVAHMQLSV